MANMGLFVVVLLTVAGVTTGQQASDVRATFNIYNMAGINYDLFAASAFCATWDGNMPLEWRMKYPWTAFCGPAGPAAPDSCGKCLLVTNSEAGTQAVVRIVDECFNGGLDLDEGVFDRLDSDGQGNAQGHLIVNYEFVDCED